MTGAFPTLQAGAQVPEGSYVIPADISAALGNGNSLVGLQMLQQLGGNPVQGQGDGTSDSIPVQGPSGPIQLSNGEVVFAPQLVDQFGGSGAFDSFVKNARDKYLKTLGAFPPPKK